MASKGIPRKDSVLDVRDARAKAKASPGTRIFSTIGKDNSSTWEPGLPSQVVSRREHKVPKVKDDAKKPESLKKIDCDPKRINGLRQEAKEEWLDRALKAIPEGRATVQDIFEVVTNPKFASGVERKVGRAILSNLTESYFFFSEKQRGIIEKCKLADKFGAPSDSDGEDDDEAGHRGKEFRDKEDEDPGHSQGEEEREAQLQRQEDRRRRKEQEKKAMLAAMEEERLRKEEQKRQLDAERKAFEEKEKRRKAKIGAAFNPDAEEDEETKKQIAATKKASYDLPKVPESLRGVFADAAHPWANDAMGGNTLLAEAHQQLLQKAGGPKRKKSRSPRGKSRSRSKSRSDSRHRRRRDRSRDRIQDRGRDRRSRSRRRRDRDRDSDGPKGPMSGSRQLQSAPSRAGGNRSPTPDGANRGQMRAARKAKMMQQLMGGGKF